MKLRINKKLRIGIITLLIILIGISSFLLFQQVRNSKYQEQKTPIYTYNNKGTANYKVFLKPNNLYQGSSLEEGEIYITEFVDYIKINFTCEFTGENPADLKGNYEILAKIQGFTGEGENLKTIWSKDNMIVRSKKFDIKGTSKTIKEEVKLNLQPYNEFVEEIKEASKINSQAMLTLVMNITIDGTTDYGPIEETIFPSLVIPLDTAMFEIGGNRDIDKPGVIEETTKVEIPIDSRKILLCGIIIAILILALIFVIFFTKIAPKKDPHEKLLRKIFKSHGDRFVALNSELIANDLNTRYVKSIDDLVRIADEIGKPILYKYNQDYKEINKFYVADEEQIYLLDLEDYRINHDGFLQDIEEIKIES